MTTTVQEQLTRLFGDKDPATIVARFQASKITRYSLDEILAGLNQVVEAHNTFEAASQAVSSAVDSFIGVDDPNFHWTWRHNWQKNAPANLVEASELSFNYGDAMNAWSLQRHSRECFPLTAWQKAAKEQLRVAAKINKLLIAEVTQC